VNKIQRTRIMHFLTEYSYVLLNFHFVFRKLRLLSANFLHLNFSYQDNRVTDHRLKTNYELTSFLEGDIEDAVQVYYITHGMDFFLCFPVYWLCVENMLRK